MNKKIQNEIQYNTIVNNETIAFEMLKDANRTIRYKDITIWILSALLGMAMIIFGYIATNFEVVHTTTTETIETGGDYNEYNDNASDNRNITNNNGVVE